MPRDDGQDTTNLKAELIGVKRLAKGEFPEDRFIERGRSDHDFRQALLRDVSNHLDSIRSYSDEDAINTLNEPFSKSILAISSQVPLFGAFPQIRDLVQRLRSRLAQPHNFGAAQKLLWALATTQPRGMLASQTMWQDIWDAPCPPHWYAAVFAGVRLNDHRQAILLLPELQRRMRNAAMDATPVVRALWNQPGAATALQSMMLDASTPALVAQLLEASHPERLLGADPVIAMTADRTESDTATKPRVFDKRPQSRIANIPFAHD